MNCNVSFIFPFSILSDRDEKYTFWTMTRGSKPVEVILIAETYRFVQWDAMSLLFSHLTVRATKEINDMNNHPRPKTLKNHINCSNVYIGPVNCSVSFIFSFKILSDRDKKSLYKQWPEAHNLLKLSLIGVMYILA